MARDESLDGTARRVLEHLRAARRVPTLREIGEGLGLTHSTVQGAVGRLAARGLVAKGKGARGLEVRGAAGCELPIAGLVAAGKPVAPPDETGPLGYFDFAEAFRGDQMLEVCGDSMVGIGIHDGDLVLFEPAETAEPGDVVVACVNGGYTIKVFRRRRGRVFLDACNKDVPPIEVGDGDEARVIGLYAGLVRKGRRRVR